MKTVFHIIFLIAITELVRGSIKEVTLDNIDNNNTNKERSLFMGPSKEELAERQARKDKNILELKMMIAESKKDNEIRGINAKLEELEQNAAEIQDTMYAKLGELMNLVSRIRAQKIAGARAQAIGITP